MRWSSGGNPRRFSRRSIAFGCLLVFVAGGLIAFWSWYRGSRDWRASGAGPLFSDIEPADGATVYGGDAWIRWSSPVAARGRVLWRSAGGMRINSADAGSGRELLARVGSLSPSSRYEYIVEENDGTQTRRSPVRTLTVKSGLAFDPIVEQTLDHDYDQTVKLTLRNGGSQPVRISARALKQYDDLPSDVTGYGSVDVPATLAPNSTLDLRLAVTAADAARDKYDIPVEAAGAYIDASFHVRRPKLNLVFRLVGEDPRTLAKTIEVQNNGDTLTDLAVGVVEANQNDLTLEPSMNHTRLEAHGAVRFTATPILYLEFDWLKASVEARAAGQNMSYPVEFRVPPRTHLIAFRSGSETATSTNDVVCTNRPNPCSVVASPPGNGPAPQVENQSRVPPPGGCNPANCHRGNACKTIAEMQGLIATDVDTYLAKVIDSYSDFAARLDRLIQRLRDADLACCFNQGVDPSCGSAIAKIQGDRNALKMITTYTDPPRSRECNVGEVNTPNSEQQGRCADYQRIQDIKAQLGALANEWTCNGGAKGPKDRDCPEMDTIEAVENQAEWDAKFTKALSEVARKNDPELTKGLEDTEQNFDNIASYLGKLTKLGKTCADIKKLIEELKAFFGAIREINAAGCNMQGEAKGFDDLANAAGALAQNIKGLNDIDPELGAIVDAFANESGFFQKMASYWNPERTYQHQFPFVDGYIPNCPASGQ